MPPATCHRRLFSVLPPSPRRHRLPPPLSFLSSLGPPRAAPPPPGRPLLLLSPPASSPEAGDGRPSTGGAARSPVRPSEQVLCCLPGMKGGCLHRLLVSKLCFGVVVLLTVPIIVLLLEGAPVLTIFNTRPEQLKVNSNGIIQQQEQEHLGDDRPSLAGLPGSASRSHTNKGRGRVNKVNSLCHVFPNTSCLYCNYAKGKWVEDDKRPLYSGNE
nr:unnamed protein product [Digitaria exilis]